MKIWGIIATVLLVVSLFGNVWLCTGLHDLSAISSKFEGVPSGPEYFPPQAMDNIRAGFDSCENMIIGLVSENQRLNAEVDQLEDRIWKLEEYEECCNYAMVEIPRLEAENELYREAILQIQQEAERASQQQWENLLWLIFSFMF